MKGLTQEAYAKELFILLIIISLIGTVCYALTLYYNELFFAFLFHMYSIKVGVNLGHYETTIDDKKTNYRRYKMLSYVLFKLV